MEVVLALSIVLAGLVILVPDDPARAIDVSIARRFPTASLDLLQRHDADVRVLAEYGWGGYVINRLYPSGGRVFVDGRNDMYDEAILRDYSAIRAADDGWEDLVADYGVEAFLFPPDVPLVRGFAQDAGWCEAYRDDNEVLVLPSCP